jgi:hypothetical protein
MIENNKAAASPETVGAASRETEDDALAAVPREDVVTLELSDLLSDSNGEIVLFNDSHLPALAVRVESPPVASGEVGSHVTAAGDDVTGYRFVAFDDGTKLFYQDSMDLVILGANGDTHG